MAKILCCGIVTLDIINSVSHYPAEDEEMRAEHQEHRSGGNAANTAMVLSQHGHKTDFAGTIAGDASGRFLEKSLNMASVGTSLCSLQSGCTPTSYITLNCINGSRTIIHHRDLREMDASDFKGIPFDDYDWIHFEGRNIESLIKVLPGLRNSNSRFRLSLEAEKPRDNISALFPFADIILFSRGFAEDAGYANPEQFLRAQRSLYPDQLLTCTWGAEGVWHSAYGTKIVHTPAINNINVVDTIGAGDTFNAGLIHALVEGQSPVKAVRYANKLAARKISQSGFENLLKTMVDPR